MLEWYETFTNIVSDIKRKEHQTYSCKQFIISIEQNPEVTTTNDKPISWTDLTRSNMIVVGSPYIITDQYVYYKKIEGNYGERKRVFREITELFKFLCNFHNMEEFCTEYIKERIEHV